MRRFNWTKINNRAAKGTFWELLDESQYKIHPRELEKFFGIVENKKKVAVKEVAKPKVISLLETRRSQNLCKSLL